YKNKKIKELESYEDIDTNKEKLEKEISELKSLMDKKAQELSSTRKNHIKTLEDSINEYLEMLYMSKAKLTLEAKEMDESGIDRLDIKINKNSVENLSSGEFNRTRLALLAAKVKFNTKSNTQVLFLDEIDANLSGEESASVANVLKFLSSRFQIFAISHQAQLTSKADKHFLVKKENEITQIKELSKDERIAEIARIVSKEEITKEALLYAKKLFE
ncbi:MAG: repair protein RecN, partial [Campylobacterota bacterium]|nr:repair protein RecN [Campylobacterota bacterium]